MPRHRVDVVAEPAHLRIAPGVLARVLGGRELVGVQEIVPDAGVIEEGAVHHQLDVRGAGFQIEQVLRPTPGFGFGFGLRVKG